MWVLISRGTLGDEVHKITNTVPHQEPSQEPPLSSRQRRRGVHAASGPGLSATLGSPPACCCCSSLPGHGECGAASAGSHPPSVPRESPQGSHTWWWGLAEGKGREGVNVWIGINDGVWVFLRGCLEYVERPLADQLFLCSCKYPEKIQVNYMRPLTLYHFSVDLSCREEYEINL